jgi:hypothetical protein
MVDQPNERNYIYLDPLYHIYIYIFRIKPLDKIIEMKNKLPIF